MKSKRSLADIAARVLAADAKKVPAPAPEARTQAILAVAGAMRLRKRRKRVRLAALGALSLAASVALAVGLGRARHETAPVDVAAAKTATPAAAASFVRGSPAILRQGTRVALADGTPLEEGDRVLVEHGSRATVALANGTYLQVEELADLVLTSTAPSTSFELATGSVRADVAKLKPHERFVIRTADAEIEVHGTSFEVSRVAPDPTCGNGTTTRVTVREGVVAVRAHGAESFVRANEVWPSGCGASAASAPASAASAAASADNAPASAASAPASADNAAGSTPANAIPTAVSTAGAASHGRSPAPRASDLAAQNDLFERAVARKRAGDTAGAVAGFDDLLARHPSSHLAQSARAERMKLLRGIDGKRARAAARDYLERYPNGFARRDAELIVSGE
ncbi:MAG: FecR domain-containing protein [Labilithrix sp.]|nr:FecR domain-containing protein [Labilithrix sp.]